jgi:hypothetical protein
MLFISHMDYNMGLEKWAVSSVKMPTTVGKERIFARLFQRSLSAICPQGLSLSFFNSQKDRLEIPWIQDLSSIKC